MSDIFESAVRILAFGPQFKKILFSKLKLKGYSEEQIYDVLEKLESLDYINDEKVGFLFAGSLVKNKFYGPMTIKAKLMEKGVSRDIISKIISEVYKEYGGEYSVCLKCFEKIIKTGKELPYNKLFTKLTSKGFNPRVIAEILKDNSISNSSKAEF